MVFLSRNILARRPASAPWQVPVDLVIDHSVQVDVAGVSNALAINMQREFERNSERFGFLKWGAKAFDNMLVVPPGSGIVHQASTRQSFCPSGSSLLLSRDGSSIPGTF